MALLTVAQLKTRLRISGPGESTAESDADLQRMRGEALSAISHYLGRPVVAGQAFVVETAPAPGALVWPVLRSQRDGGSTTVAGTVAETTSAAVPDLWARADYDSNDPDVPTVVGVLNQVLFGLVSHAWHHRDPAAIGEGEAQYSVTLLQDEMPPEFAKKLDRFKAQR